MTTSRHLNGDEIDLNTIPATALNVRCMEQLSRLLNPKQILPAKNGTVRDYRGLAELMDFEYSDIRNFERFPNPTMEVLLTWISKPNQFLGMLITFLENMERHDVISDCEPFLKNDAYLYMDRRRKEHPIQDSQVTSSRGQHINIDEECSKDTSILQNFPTYDAYILYADDDLEFVLQLANLLQRPPANLKLFIRDRDMPAGVMEAAVQAQIIDEKCNRVLVILSPEYLLDPPCEFQTNFATGVATDKRMRKLIPIIYKPCEIPSVLKYYSKIDFTRSACLPWVKDRLIESIRGPSSSTFVTAPLSGSLSESIAGFSHPLRELPSRSDPIVTLPVSENHIQALPCPDEISSGPLMVTEGSDMEPPAQDTVVAPKKARKRVSKQEIFQKLKDFISLNSSGRASNASSGYQSQSTFDQN